MTPTPREMMEAACEELTRITMLPPDPSGHDWIDRARLGMRRSTIPGDVATTQADQHRPLHSDPTGEGVARRAPGDGDNPPTAAQMKRWLDATPTEKVAGEITRRLRLIRKEVLWLSYVAEASIPRLATDAESRAAELDNLEPGCTSCARAGKWQEIHRNSECQWCQRWAKDTGEPPTIEALNLRFGGMPAELRRLRSRIAARNSMETVRT